MNKSTQFFIGKNTAVITPKKVSGNFCIINDERFYKIENVNEMAPFFMSIVSNSNHWMFISSNGALTAGRKNAEFALFPYYTDDKITENPEVTGSKTIFRVSKNNATYLWEPFSDRYEGIYDLSRHLYKNTYGNKIIFEEINHDLALTYRYEWNSSNQFGFVRKSTLVNLSADEVRVELLDGLQNIMPYGVPSDLQNATSNLVDAYKRSELLKESGLGVFALSAIIVDKAEPSEALKANIAWSLGVENPLYLLSSRQLKNFRKGQSLTEEMDVKGEKGAYYISTTIILSARSEKEWMIIANVNQNHADIARLSNQIKNTPNLAQLIRADIDAGTRQLLQLVASADGLQRTADTLKDTRHFSNTMFNIMRGGIFENNYQVEKQDFTKYLSKANKKVFKEQKVVIDQLPAQFNLQTLREVAVIVNNADFERLCVEYLPLMFSRRHGDPSRPWNKFSINTQSEIDGSKVLDYQGNWRDIFQNWEALSLSYPDFLEGMIFKFLNASTFDGYNPYRVTKDGFDWETIEPDNPWSYIGYWGDHQIIYLLKLLELLEYQQQGKLANYFGKEIFVYANVPYKIKPYAEILKNSKDTIEFDEKLDIAIRQKRDKMGADGALLADAGGRLYRVNFMEKILATVLAKMSNFIPEGGIWMNTQRPEWNDANNALVGNGVSMVTLYYLRRFLHFFNEVLVSAQAEQVEISEEMADFFRKMMQTLENHRQKLSGKLNDADRKQILDGLSTPASDYRTAIYEKSFSGKKTCLAKSELMRFMELGAQYLEQSIRANKRTDNLYHAYNLMTLKSENEISISHLSEMLEGQVALLSSGYLSSEEALELLGSLKKSKLYRDNQSSYILYPNKNLPKFSEKNIVSPTSVEKSELLLQLIEKNNTQIIEKDVNGAYHFNGNFKNAGDLQSALDSLTEFKPLVDTERDFILQIFEETFNHKAFTGRSGTFFAYEGLGSIYWHMVSKLQLAVQEYCVKAYKDNESNEVIGRLSKIYYDVNEGIGVHKSPEVYGAFPFDPYSHAPADKGVKQPGMTGQVKEDIICRFGELGVSVENGKLRFDPFLLRDNEWLNASQSFDYVNVNSENKTILLNENSLAFTYCQVPVMYHKSEKEMLRVTFSNGNTLEINGKTLDDKVSRMIFDRSGEVERLDVFF